MQSNTQRRGKGKALLAAAASVAAASLLSSSRPALADGTAAINNMNGNRTWTNTGVWTWTGDTGGQVFPGDGVGPGAGTEAAIVRPIFGGRTLNVPTSYTTPITIGSFTLEQTQDAVTRGLNVNYDLTTDPKLQLNTSLIQHVDAPGVVSSGGGSDGLTNALIFNQSWALNGGNLVLNANTAPTVYTSAHVNHRANIAIKFDDSDVTFTGLTLRGNKSVEFENNVTNRVAIWNMNGDINLEGTGQLRLRYMSQGANGDLVLGTSGLNNLVAAASGTGYANIFFERAASVGTAVVNRFKFNNTILNSNLFYDPNNAHVSLGNIQVNGVRNSFIFDGTAATTANGSDYTSISGDANSEWILNTGGATWAFATNVASTMLGKISIVDGTAGFNAVGAMGATAIGRKFGVVDLNTTPGANDRFDIRTNGALKGNNTQLAALTVGTNLTLEKGSIIVHETLGASADTTTTVGNLTPNTALFGIGGDTSTTADFNITVGGAADLWAGLGSDRSQRRWNRGVITANGDFTIQSGARAASGSSLIFGSGTASVGSLSIVNNTGNPEVNVTVANRVDLAHNNSNFVGTHFRVTNGAEVRLYADGALGSARATVFPGGTIIASSGGNGGSTALNGNVHIMSGGAIQINSKDINGVNAGLNGSGTITRDDNIIVWTNIPQALSGTQFNATNLRNGDLLRMETDNLQNLDQAPGGLFIQLRSANRTASTNINLDGGAIFTDGGSRALDGSGLTINVGSNGATFAASTPTLVYDDPTFAPVVNVTGTQTLTINMPVRANAAATAAGLGSAPVRIGSTSPLDGLNMAGTVIFNQAFVAPGNVVKTSASDLIFNGPETVIGGDLVAGGGAPGMSPNVKFGNNVTTLSDSIISGTVIAGRLILGSGTKTDLNIATPNNNGLALQSDNRLDVGLKIVVDGAMAADGRRIYVDRRDTTAGTFGLINLNQVTINPNAFISVDEANTDVRIKNPTVLGNFTIDRGSGDPFDFENLNAAAPITVTHGVVQSTAGNTVADTGFFGTIGSNVTINNVRGQVRLENGAVLNGTINTQNVPTGGDSWVRIFGGQNGTGFVSGSGQVNLGGLNDGSGAIGDGEDFYVYINDNDTAPITNTVPIRVNILAGQKGTIVSDRSGTDTTFAGNAVVTNVHMQPGSTLFLGQNQDTTLSADLVLEGDATVKHDDTTPGATAVRNVTGAFNLAVETGSLGRPLNFNGNATNTQVTIGAAGPSQARLNNGANLPNVVVGSQGQLYVLSTEAGSVAKLTSTNPASDAVTVEGRLTIRPAASAATATTSKVASLNITATGTLDLGAANRLAIDYAEGNSPISTVRQQIIAGFNGGAWTGQGITSSSAAANPSLGIGYAEASELIGSTGGQFGSETVDGSAVLVRTTLLGDANLDGSVDFNDLVKLAQNYNTSVTATTESWWLNGDFTYDGQVDFNDLVKLAQNYNTALPADAIPGAPASFQADLAAAFAAVPEPSTAALALIAACGLAGRRRRRKAR